MKFLQVSLIGVLGVILVSGKSIQEERRLIKTSAEEPGKWMTEEEIFGLIRQEIKFVDVTDLNLPQFKPDEVNVKAIPTELRFNETVLDLTARINDDRIQDFVRTFSSYHNRYYSAQTGRDSQLWLLSEVLSSVEGYAGNASVAEVDHGYLQRSIIAKLTGSDPQLGSEVVIIGAHLDSVNRFGATLQAPGADDNGSGSVVLLETLRAIVESGLVLKRTLEFQWYAAEEIGLRGSGAIAQLYRQTDVNVVGMLNLDVLGYQAPGINDIGVFTDNGNDEVIQFLRILADGYLTFGRRDQTCGYGCSDHASWTNAGFPAAMASEYIPNPDMHTVQDNFEGVSFEQVNEFVKITIGFSVELSEPNN